MDVLEYFISTLKEAPELHDPEAEEPAINALLIDDLKETMDNILQYLNIIEFLTEMLSNAADLYPDNCSVPDDSILKWVCDQISMLVDDIEDEFNFIEANPLGNINVLYLWFKPYIMGAINSYMRDLGPDRYKDNLDNSECNTGYIGLKGTVTWIERYGIRTLRFYTTRLRQFADRPEFN